MCSGGIVGATLATLLLVVLIDTPKRLHFVAAEVVGMRRCKLSGIGPVSRR